ncbi:MAG: hypothetical protein WCL01_09195 [Comamonadaceae bacterium]|jgi:hypothetical protein
MKKTTSKNLNPIQETGLTVPDPLDPKYVGTYSPPGPYQTHTSQQDLDIVQNQNSDTWQSPTMLSPSEIESLRLDSRQASLEMKAILASQAKQ